MDAWDTHLHAYAQSCMHPHMNAFIYTYKHAYSSASMYTKHIFTLTHMHACLRSCMPTCTHPIEICNIFTYKKRAYMSANILWGILHHYKKPSMHGRPSGSRTYQTTAIRQKNVNPYGLKTLLFMTVYAHICMHIHIQACLLIWLVHTHMHKGLHSCQHAYQHAWMHRNLHMTYTHICRHTYMQARTYPHACLHLHNSTCKYTCMKHTPMNARLHTWQFAYQHGWKDHTHIKEDIERRVHANTYTCILTRILSYMQRHACMHVSIHAYIHTCMHKYTQECKHTHL
jgi:hypothetical protein